MLHVALKWTTRDSPHEDVAVILRARKPSTAVVQQQMLVSLLSRPALSQISRRAKLTNMRAPSIWNNADIGITHKLRGGSDGVVSADRDRSVLR